MRKICVLGLGYVGLPTAAMFASCGHEVVGVDVNGRLVEALCRGEIHPTEPGLGEVVAGALQSGNLRAQTHVEEADAFIIAVPTPLTADKRADLSYVSSACDSLVPHVRRGNIVILESTVPPRTSLDLVKPILETSGLKAGEGFSLAHSPERVLPTRILTELVENDRVVGGFDSQSGEGAMQLYKSFVTGSIVLTDLTTAEMVKLMENTYRDVNIALANEFALLAEHVGIDVWEAIELANRHPRVSILRPGPGVGGHCIPVDPWFLVQVAPHMAPLITAARGVNDAMPQHVAEIVKLAVAGVENPVVACLGLAYKANVDDVRESPAVKIVELLQKQGLDVRAYDPHVPDGVVSCRVERLELALCGADVVVLATDHREFAGLSPSELCNSEATVLVDARGVLASDVRYSQGVELRAVGRQGRHATGHAIPCDTNGG